MKRVEALPNLRDDSRNTANGITVPVQPLVEFRTNLDIRPHSEDVDLMISEGHLTAHQHLGRGVACEERR